MTEKGHREGLKKYGGTKHSYITTSAPVEKKKEGRLKVIPVGARVATSPLRSGGSFTEERTTGKKYL